MATAASAINELISKLSRRTSAEVRFDEGSQALYASDLSHYRQLPIGVVVPRSIDDVIETVAVCHEYDVPILGRGAGTSLAGQTCNTAVVIDFSKYLNKILELNAKEKYAWVEPGVINDHLRGAAEKYGLTFAPDPATHQYCTIGGMIGNNSCGAHSVMGGKTSENVEALDVLTYDGTRMIVGETSPRDYKRILAEGGRRAEIYRRLSSLAADYAEDVRQRFPQIPRRVSGYNLDYLLPNKQFHVARALVGSESTCVLVLGAKVRLMHSPPCRVMLLISYADVFAAGDQAHEISGFGPIAIEGFQKKVIENELLKERHPAGLELYNKGDAWLIVEFGGETHKEALAKAEKAHRWLERKGAIAVQLLESKTKQENAMRIRELGLGSTRVPGKTPDTYTGWEDAAVPPQRLGAYLREFYKLLDQYNYLCVLYGHFGQGCMHTRMNFGMKSALGVQKYKEFVTEAAHLVVRFGGSLSGEHGDGQSRGELLPIMFGERLMKGFREFKGIWDPQWKMNPGKVVDAYPLDSNLRTGPDYKPKPVLTIFQFPDDHGSMAEATERCFGVGKCRALDAGTMCPSFQVTREEQHSTRGRARLLFEMLRGDVLQDGWRDPHIFNALDLCLACKGCKGDCPVSVDVATYKAEFLSHYYEGRLRPAAAYSMGMIDKWASVASKTPSLANLVMQTPGLSNIAKAVGGITQERDLPAFPPQTFKSWFSSRNCVSYAKVARGEVILWPDTFNNYLFPHTAMAATEVLEDAGFRVRVPQPHLCCGRPLYDFGMLDLAKDYLRKVLAAMQSDIAQGTPIVCLEPSCASVFRDELVNLFPSDPDAKRLQQQVVLLPDFLDRVGYRPASLRGKALVHGHCHQKALFSMMPESRLLSFMGLEPEVLNSGCCGLAGSFGYEAEHYGISMQIGERVLLPRVREAERDTIIVADGFSCRQQIAHGTRRRAMHIAEVLQMALRPERRRKKFAESGHVQPEPGGGLRGLLAIGAVSAVAAMLLMRRRSGTPDHRALK